MWNSLLFKLSIKEGLTPRIINGRWVSPIISGQRKGELKRLFKIAELPWIYEEPKGLHSLYQRTPKLPSNVQLFEKKMDAIRNAIAENAKKEEEYYKQNLAKKKISQIDLLMQNIYPSLQNKFQTSKNIEAHADEILEDDEKDNEEPDAAPSKTKVKTRTSRKVSTAKKITNDKIRYGKSSTSKELLKFAESTVIKKMTGSSDSVIPLFASKVGSSTANSKKKSKKKVKK